MGEEWGRMDKILEETKAQVEGGRWERGSREMVEGLMPSLLKWTVLAENELVAGQDVFLKIGNSLWEGRL